MNQKKRVASLGRRLVSVALAAGLTVSSGCATLAHRNANSADSQTKSCGRSGEACPWLVGDALLLIPFLIPGVIAFIVDFSTGEWKHGEYGGEVRTASSKERETPSAGG